MKKSFVIIMGVAALMAMSCSKTAKLENDAKASAEAIMREKAKDPTSVQITDQSVIYSDDSLCILQMNFSGKNGFGIESSSRMEYIYIISEGKSYEAYHALDEDSIYMSQEAFEKNRTGKIYEKLDYVSALRYKAALFTNTHGRAVGDKAGEVDVKIPIPTGTGLWELHSYIDEFRKETGSKFILLVGNGVFSNSATTASEMTALLYFDKSSVTFRFIEYNSSLVKDEGLVIMKIKDSEGVIHDNMFFYNTESGNITPSALFNDKEYNEMLEIVKKGGIISVVAECGTYSTSRYVFEMDVTGFEKAIEYTL